MSDRRAENRYLCADMVRLDFLRGETELVSAEAVLEDISPPGACVQVDEKLAMGANVTLRLGESEFQGRVCYCVYRDYGYFIGIEFEDGTKWSSQREVPQHLTNLRLLAGSN